MTGLTIEVKCKNIEAYRLGGVQKIEFERHTLDENTNFDYIATTIFDTRRYAYENVEYIKVYGGAVVTTDDELQYILKYAAEEDFGYDVCRKQLRSLWTSYCLRRDLECDTATYDSRLRELWEAIDKNTSCPWQDDEDEGVAGFDLFDGYMCEQVV